MKFTYYVETFRPCFQDGGGLKFCVTRMKQFDIDRTHPCLTALFRVENVKTRDEAIAAVIEKLAGHRVSVYQILPKQEK